MKGLITCEECGYEGMPYAFVWFQGEIAICRDGDTCRQRQLESGIMTQPPEFPIIEIEDKNPNKYQDKARQIVLEHYNQNFLDVGEELHIREVFIVWFAKTLQNWKALVATEVVDDGLYFEVTHNGDKNETYIDVYKKIGNAAISATGHSVNRDVIDWSRPGANLNQRND